MAQNNREKALKFMETTSDADIYEDYWRAREQAKSLNNPNLIINDKSYPILPTSCVKYVRYVENGRIGYHTTRNINSFVQYIDATYKNFKFTKNSDGDVTGALITMATQEHCNYLHDELTSFISFLQDKARQADFSAAVKHDKKFEFDDPETGLCVIAPRDITALKEEGSTLSHCVASYVDSICNQRDHILFIRRRDMVDFPYYTADLVKGANGKYSLRQLHGYRNNNTSADDQRQAYINSNLEVYNKTFDIIKFVHKWADAKAELDSTSIKSTYGLLCALR